MNSPAGPSADVTVLGQLDAVDAEWLARGWCWSPQQPDRRRSVVILADDAPLATALCDRLRPELRDLGMGDGAHGFEVRLPHSRLPRRVTTELRLRDAETGAAVGGAFPLRRDADAPSPAATMRYHLDRVQEEGLVSGWCWDPSEPERRVRLLVLADGETIGATTADQFRGDLRDAGVGDGAHGFTFLLPWEAIADRSMVHVRLADEASGEALGASVLFRRPTLVPIEERIRLLEHEVRLMGARVEDARSQARHDAAVLGGVLGTIGAFFTRLSQVALEEVPTALVPSLSELVGGLAERLAPISLAVPAESLVTLCVQADGPIASIHACLRAIHAAELDSRAEVFLLDDGRLDEVALLPSLVQNLRLWRVQPGQSVVSTRNHIALPAGRPFIAFLSSAVRVTSGWLSEVLATFEREPECAVVGAKVLRDDETVEAWGLLPDRHGRLSDPARAEHALDPRYDMLQQVAAVTDLAAVVRGETFERLGGFDARFTDPRAATTDLCLRCWADGARVLVQPVPSLRWDGTATASDAGEAALDPDLGDLLADRCTTEVLPTWTEPKGRVLLLDVQLGSSEVDVMMITRAWRRLGWQAEFALADTMDAEGGNLRALRAHGVRVLRAPFQPSVATVLREAPGRYGAVQVTGAAAQLLPPGRLRAMAPGAKIVLTLDRRDTSRSAAELGSWARDSDQVLVQHAPDVKAALGAGESREQLSAPEGSQPETASRSGLWLFGDGKGRLATQVVMHLTRKAPEIGLHAPRWGPVAPSRGVILHETTSSAAPPVDVRLALWLGRPGTVPDPEAVVGCLMAGVPVLLAGGMDAAPPGTLALAGEARVLVARVLSLHRDDSAWQALSEAAKSGNAACEARMAERLRVLLDANAASR